MFKTLENFLANFSFFTLFFSVIFYWVQTSNLCFFTQKRKTPALVFAPSEGGHGQIIQGGETPLPQNPSFFLISLLGQPFNDFTGGKSFLSLGTSGMILSNFSIVFLLFLRWKESGHFPLSNLYESLLFLSWGLTVLHLFIENFTNPQRGLVQPSLGISTSQKAPLWGKKIILGKLIGCITAPSALFTNAFATFSLPIEMKETIPLVPALQSNWLMMHVTVMILSYAALILGSLFSIAFLIVVGWGPNSLDNSSHKRGATGELRGGQQSYTFNLATEDLPSVVKLIPQGSHQHINKSKQRWGTVQSTPLPHIGKTLDHLSYRIIGIGFPFLTLGILSGAVWANEAWGAYWSWDPKETWALLTWLVFAIYLHTRLTKGWEGQKPAFIASFGFIIIWICFLGVNLIGEGLHSYGWFSA